jgi:hypothetical protein
MSNGASRNHLSFTCIHQGFQAITKILTKSKFFEDSPKIVETIIDEHIEIFRELGAIAEGLWYKS